jgi:hypothetical protein
MRQRNMIAGAGEDVLKIYPLTPELRWSESAALG